MSKEKKLVIYYDVNGERNIRYVAEKWQWQDTVMGEQYITFTAYSENPIPFSVGDYCIYRGETYTLNYKPSETQNANPSRVGNGFEYDSIKFDSYQEELTRCQMRDITPTTGMYKPSLGTNYTGSTTFQLYCGEVIANGQTYTPVCALAAKMQANLDEMFRDADGNPLWRIIVNTTTYHQEYGKDVFDTHTDEKMLSFSNNYVSEALAMVYNEFKLNYCIKGRTIYIGYEFGDLTTYDPSNPTTSQSGSNVYSFGYGKGMPSRTNPNKGLFQVKKVSNPSQQILTRLRAFGSKKNLPYRYYNKKYNLSQSLFPVNLMLPDTFLSITSKRAGNITRRTTYPGVLDVLGNSNDSYIEKNNNAKVCVEGIREGSAFWDGSNDELEEIYPTIEGTTYGELRAANVPDMDGNVGRNAFPNYDANERIDEILEVCPDTNIGNGINYDEATNMKVKVTGGVSSLPLPTKNAITYIAPQERLVATFNGVSAGQYLLTQTAQYANIYAIYLSSTGKKDNMKGGFQISVKVTPESGGDGSVLNTSFTRQLSFTALDGKFTVDGYDTTAYIDKIPFPEFKDKDNLIATEATSKVEIFVKFLPTATPTTDPADRPSKFDWGLSNSNLMKLEELPNINGNLILAMDGVADTFQETPFHVIIKDVGFDITAAFGDDKHTIYMKNGNCVAREFPIGDYIEKVDVLREDGKYVKGYKLYLTTRDVDDVLNTFFPSQAYPINPGDQFVLLGIEMPEVFIKAAEIRLLKAATEYLKENSDTKFTYQPFIDDIYIERDYDDNIAKNTPEQSIYWRLYAGLKFTMRDIPKSANETSFDTISMMIQSVTIKEGDKYTPQIDITLNDDIQQSTLQKIQASVNKIANVNSQSVSLGNTLGGGSSQGGTQGVDAVLSADLVATDSIGNIRVGDKFIKGTSLEDVLRQLLSGDRTIVKNAPTFAWINCPPVAEYGTAKEDLGAKAELNNATELRAVFLSVNGEQETDITSSYDASTGYVTHHQGGEYLEDMEYIMKGVFVYEDEDYPISIKAYTNVLKPIFVGSFDTLKRALTESDIKSLDKFVGTSKSFSITGGHTIAFAVPSDYNFNVDNVTEDGFSADWSDWDSSSSSSIVVRNVNLGSKASDYKVYLAYSEGGFGEVKGTIKIS